MTAEDQAILSNPAADAPLEMKKPLVPSEGSGLVSAASNTTDGVPASAESTDKKEDDDTGKKEKDKDEKPRSLAAVKVVFMKLCDCAENL